MCSPMDIHVHAPVCFLIQDMDKSTYCCVCECHVSTARELPLSMHVFVFG